ncbi:hypothetical protein [Collimonas arenae]|uniref:hypothetical protein n=1 Tax=Collimonas arenae TaxID=279058 RepID=UPI0005717960|nr:hypothetical protein [Collimonas arenae]
MTDKRKRWMGLSWWEWVTLLNVLLLNVMCWWFGPDEFGNRPLRWFAGSALLFIIGQYIYWAWCRGRLHIAYDLYYQDIFDGICPDRGADINYKNGWKWYRKQGYPKQIDPSRQRRYRRT